MFAARPACNRVGVSTDDARCLGDVVDAASEQRLRLPSMDLCRHCCLRAIEGLVERNYPVPPTFATGSGGQCPRVGHERDPPALCLIDSGRSDPEVRVIKLIGTAYKRDDFTTKEFFDYWFDVHVPISATLPGLRGYVVSEVVRKLGGEWRLRLS